MGNEEKNRLIDLFIRAAEGIGQSEGIHVGYYGLSKDEQDEVDLLIKEFKESERSTND